jgi:hypothetical protein
MPSSAGRAPCLRRLIGNVGKNASVPVLAEFLWLATRGQDLHFHRAGANRLKNPCQRQQCRVAGKLFCTWPHPAKSAGNIGTLLTRI